MKRILVIGRTGQVGWELARTLAPLAAVASLDRGGLDLCDPDSIRTAVRKARPEVIVNAAAYTAVDKAESEAELAMAINGIAPGILAEEARRAGALLVHYSTDYVFDGTKAGPYAEDDQPNPIGAYGKTKLAGEQAIQQVGGRHLILRTAWVYGLRGRNFLLTMKRLAEQKDELRVVDDQFGAPTWSRMIAEATALLLAAREPAEGLYHFSSTGQTSWFGFAQAIVSGTRALRGREPRVMPIPTAEYPTPAKRPANSRLDCTRLLCDTGVALPPWRDALNLCLQDLAETQAPR
ncbi:MAG TPA: dTDP-4-dehydrorhamnose reductase [Rhodocyclaceae bacterium]